MVSGMICTAQISCSRSITAQRSSTTRVVLPTPFRAAVRVPSRASKWSTSARAKDVEAEIEEEAVDFSEKVGEYIDIITTKWEETDEKPAVIAISFASFIAIWAASGIIDAINRTLLGGAFEVIGLGVTGWFVYRYLINGSDREELKENIDDFFKKMGAE